jgi:signal transduction histidine kinase
MGTRRLTSLFVWARDRPLVADGFLGVLLAAVSLLALVFQARSEHLPPPGLPAVALVLAINLPLVWRRRHPFAINMAIGAMSAVYGATPFPDLVTPVPLGGAVALYSMVAWCDRRMAVIVGVVTGVSVVTVALLPATDTDLLDFSFTTLLLAGAWVLGDSARIRRAYTVELEARAAWLAREQDFEARRAVTAERARIARELHDVIAHHVSMMVVQAEAGPVAVARDGTGAARAFDTIADIGRQALVEMRRLLGVLREETGGKEPSLAPQPGVAQLPGLVEHIRQAGLDAGLEIDGDPVPLPAGVDLSVYRIVQEALTNVLKHAGQVRVRVRVRYGDQDLRVEVCDQGLGKGRGRDAQADPEGDAAPAEGNGRPGHGLIGMRERVHLFGGELSAGPRPDGGFTVAARLPIGGTR